MRKKDLSATDLYIPYVLQKGNASLDEMVKPILKEIATWARTRGEKELVLVGISNGGRIARAIDAVFAKSGNMATIKKLRFVSVVGACNGAYSANIVNRLGLSWILSKNISEEMPIDSARNQRLNKEWRDGLSHGPKRDYTFIASPHDWIVPNYDSTLMEVGNNNARYALVSGHGHITIVGAVAKTVAELVLS